MKKFFFRIRLALAAIPMILVELLFIDQFKEFAAFHNLKVWFKKGYIPTEDEE